QLYGPWIRAEANKKVIMVEDKPQRLPDEEGEEVVPPLMMDSNSEISKLPESGSHAQCKQSEIQEIMSSMESLKGLGKRMMLVMAMGRVLRRRCMDLLHSFTVI
ncbi:hypothetical protein PanWU01x14_312560, partial [Parasponia andersonii]